MRKMLFIFGIIIMSFIGLSTVNAGSVKLSMSCPNAAKPNTEITCVVYAEATESNVDTVEEIYTTPTGALKKSDYFINPTLIVTNRQNNIGKIVIQTGNTTGSGQIGLVLEAIHFVDGTFQQQATITKNITINKTGKITNNNNVSSGTNTNTTQSSTNKDTYLQDIKISRGILSPSFSKNVYKYNVKVDSDVDKISIDGIKNDANQKIEGEVEGKDLNYGKNTFKLVVSNGTNNKRTYEVIVEREDNRDTDAKLSALSLSSGTINFNPNIHNYETKVLNEIQNIEVVATTTKKTSTIKVEGEKNLQVGENNIIVTVTAEKGNTEKYIIKVTRIKAGETIGDNANIKNITIEGYNINFNYSKRNYKLLIKNEDKLIINVEMDDLNARYQVFGNENLKDGSNIQIVTTSYDDNSTETYNIEIAKPNYTIYYVIGGVLASLAVAAPIVFYFRYGKTKKDLVDINGNRITKEQLKNENKSKYRKRLSTTIPLGNKNKEKQTNIAKNQVKPNIKEQAIINKIETQNNEQAGTIVSVPGKVVEQNQEPIVPQFVVNISNQKKEESISTESSNTTNQVINQNFNSSQCPKCERELIGSPEVCPYCNTKLK